MKSLCYRRPTINDVAARARVSKKTVSRVINSQEGLTQNTRRRVQEAIKELGYTPNPQARALALRRNATLVLFHDNPNAQTVLNFQSGVLEGIADSGMAMFVRPVNRSSNGMLDDVRSFIVNHRPSGALVLPPLSEHQDLADLLSELRVHYVRVGSAPLDSAVRCVSSNDRGAVADACRLLISKGHRKIGFVRGPPGFLSATEREMGFKAAMREAGLALDESLCVEGNYLFASGVSAGLQLLRCAERPTAIFASNDEMAAGVMHAALSMKIDIPTELSVIGFDDSPTAAHIWPPLTTVRWPMTDMGKFATEKLIGEITGDVGETTGSTILSSSIILRDTVAEVQTASRKTTF